jgi:hypothetical protein
MYDLVQQAHHDGNNTIAIALKISIRPTRMHCSAIRTAITLYPQRFSETLKIPLCISMPPQSQSFTPRTLPGFRPGISLAKGASCIKALYIYRAIQ